MTIRRPSSLALLVAALVVVPLAGCGEKPQTAAGTAVKKADTPGWEGGQAAYNDGGWKTGDKAAWEAHLKARVERGQNEYPRTTSARK
jgi:hypothetical protein